MTTERIRILVKPYRPLIPCAAVAALLSVAWVGVHYMGVVPAQQRLVAVEADWTAARGVLAKRLEAKQSHKDLTRVMTTLMTSRDFARLPLVLSDMAKRDHVMLPALSYTLEKSSEGFATKALLQGSATGQYEDIRRFIHHLETSDRLLLFVEDLGVGGSSEAKGEQKGKKKITVTIRLATYVREQPQQGNALRASVQ
jgi:hypothetical protein